MKSFLQVFLAFLITCLAPLGLEAQQEADSTFSYRESLLRRLDLLNVGESDSADTVKKDSRPVELRAFVGAAQAIDSTVGVRWAKTGRYVSVRLDGAPDIMPNVNQEEHFVNRFRELFSYIVTVSNVSVAGIIGHPSTRDWNEPWARWGDNEEGAQMFGGGLRAEVVAQILRDSGYESTPVVTGSNTAWESGGVELIIAPTSQTSQLLLELRKFEEKMGRVLAEKIRELREELNSKTSKVEVIALVDQATSVTRFIPFVAVGADYGNTGLMLAASGRLTNEMYPVFGELRFAKNMGTSSTVPSGYYDLTTRVGADWSPLFGLAGTLHLSTYPLTGLPRGVPQIYLGAELRVWKVYLSHSWGQLTQEIPDHILLRAFIEPLKETWTPSKSWTGPGSLRSFQFGTEFQIWKAVYFQADAVWYQSWIPAGSRWETVDVFVEPGRTRHYEQEVREWSPGPWDKPRFSAGFSFVF